MKKNILGASLLLVGGLTAANNVFAEDTQATDNTDGKTYNSESFPEALNENSGYSVTLFTDSVLTFNNASSVFIPIVPDLKTCMERATDAVITPFTTAKAVCADVETGETVAKFTCAVSEEQHKEGAWPNLELECGFERTRLSKAVSNALKPTQP